MANWIRLPDNRIINMNLVDQILVVTLNNPDRHFGVMAGALTYKTSGVMVAETSTREQANAVIEAMLQAGGIEPVDVQTILKPKGSEVDT